MELRRFTLLALSACCLPLAAVNPSLPEVKRVYLLQMSNGLDQYLANTLTKSGRFEVVTDPALADAVFTDRIGIAFEERWKELYPPPPPATKPEETKETKDAKDTKDAQDKALDPVEFASAPFVRVSSFSRGRGNVFLVSRKTGAVVWSHYQKPKENRSNAMDETARHIVDRLNEDLQIKK